MPGAARAVDRPGAGDQVGQRPAHARLGALPGPAPRQQLAVHAERRELLGGQVDPPAVEVLADVAQEVRELEGDAQRGRVRARPRRGGRRVPSTGSTCSPITAAEPCM